MLAPKDLFSAFANECWAIWLDSGDSDHIDSRYDIIAWQPDATLVTIEQETTITDLKTTSVEQSFDDPIKLLQDKLDTCFSLYSIQQSDLPFSGGALGYFSYDLGRRFEVIPTLANKDIDIPEMVQGIYSKAIIFDNKKQQYYLVCPTPERSALEAKLHQLVSSVYQFNRFELSGDWQANITKEQYQRKFAKIQQYLTNGDCYQINLTQRFSTTFTGDEFQAYLTLRQANKAPFSAFMRCDNFAVLSVSPERFVQVKNKQVETKPIKGTLPRSSNLQQDKMLAEQLQSSVKDRAENLMIVDLLRNDLSKACIAGSVKVPKLFDVESFPAVHHLVSTIVGKLKPDHQASDLLRGAFPGGSITGAPKIRAMEIIDELEPQRRSLYCGSIGYLSACGNMDTSITIRTLVCEQNKIHCWAGGGIVADSDVDAEYQESLDKVNKILPILKNNT